MPQLKHHDKISQTISTIYEIDGYHFPGPIQYVIFTSLLDK